MGIEIERKFLLKNNDWRKLGKGELYRQGYLSTDAQRTVRIRTIGKIGYLTIKGVTQNTRREEFEYSIPLEDANSMLDTICERPLIEKTRYKINDKGQIWEVDEFWGENKGLIIAEVELRDVDHVLSIPEWIGREVTGESAYYNASLVKYPFSKWKSNLNES